MKPPNPAPVNLFDPRCPSRRFLELVGDKWTLLVLTALAGEPRRTSDLKRKVGGISQKVISTTLRKLEEHGLVSRSVYPEVPPRVEYELTRLGRSLEKAVVVLDRWIEQNFHAVAAAKARYAERPHTKPGWQIPRVA